MHKTIFGALAAVGAIIFAFGTAIPSASAHERRAVGDGKYSVVVGFELEPVFLEEQNAVLFRVSDAQTNEPVEGVEKTMKVDVSNGGQTKTFDLKPRANVKGTYVADVIPTKSGQWVFTFKGDINGTPINERFESGPGRFNEPAPKTTLQFPAPVPSNAELAQQAAAAPAQPAAAAPAQPAPVEGTSLDALSADVQRALDRADRARSTGIAVGAAGIVVGLLGLALGGIALASRRRGPGGAEPA